MVDAYRAWQILIFVAETRTLGQAAFRVRAERPLVAGVLVLLLERPLVERCFPLERDTRGR